MKQSSPSPIAQYFFHIIEMNLNWVFFFQDRLSEELYRVFGDSDRPVTMNDLLHLKYLECCIKEALRLYPSVPMLGRTLSQNVTLREYQFQIFIEKIFENHFESFRQMDTFYRLVPRWL